MNYNNNTMSDKKQTSRTGKKQPEKKEETSNQTSRGGI
jgi:hypothetical protein